MNRILFKVVVIGTSQSKRTDLVYRLLEADQPASPEKPNPMDFYSRVFNLAEGDVKLVAWDLAGEARFSMVRKSCYAGAQAAIIVFDPSDARASEDIHGWMAELAEEMNVPAILLVANTIRNEEDNQVGAAENLPPSDVMLMNVNTCTGDGIGSVREWLLETAVAKAQPVI